MDLNVLDLNTYQCHKTVHGAEMTAQAFVDFTGKTLDIDDLSVEGFIVVYGKGTSDEYVSWSPKKPFEEGYLQIHENTVPESE